MTIEKLNWEQAPSPHCREGVLTIGNFDGVHLGHAALAAEIRRQARILGGPAVVLTFDPHPLQMLRPERFQPLLTTPGDRAALLLACGVDRVVLLHTTRDLLQLTAGDFFARVVRAGFQARALVEGVNFGFGRNREGTIETLARLCGQSEMNLVVVPPTEVREVRVSSSRVRDALVRGVVREAAEYLGRSYRLTGKVGEGQRRGRTIGFPTANLEDIATLVPGDGVYAVRVHCKGKVWPGAANIGPNPTFGEQARKVEVHLIGFEGDLYGEELAVEFVERLRDTRPFANAAQLIEQLRQDVEKAHQLAADQE